MVNLNLALATSADIPAIQTLAQCIWRAHYPAIIGIEQVEYMLDKFYSEESLRQQMVEGQQFWLVQNPELKNGQSLGFLAVSDQGEGRYFLHKFYLDNEQRGQGLGKSIFALLLARYKNLRELRLTVNRQNFKSINFYFRIGFVIERCVDIPIGEGYTMADFQMLFHC